LSNLPDNNTGQKLSFFKKIGVTGFLFFLIKGLLWLAVFGATAIWGSEALSSFADFFRNLF
jgi:hypothetical protein